MVEGYEVATGVRKNYQLNNFEWGVPGTDLFSFIIVVLLGDKPGRGLFLLITIIISGFIFGEVIDLTMLGFALVMVGVLIIGYRTRVGETAKWMLKRILK